MVPIEVCFVPGPEWACNSGKRSTFAPTYRPARARVCRWPETPLKACRRVRTWTLVGVVLAALLVMAVTAGFGASSPKLEKISAGVDESAIADCGHVWAHDPETGESGPREVVTFFDAHLEENMVNITVNGDTITATQHHPFWSVTRQAWVDAGDLYVGETLLQADGGLEVVDAVQAYSHVTTVYNFEVAGLHTYFVEVDGEGVLVHNCAVAGQVREAGDAARLRAMNEIDSFSLPRKHHPDAGGHWSKFAHGVDFKQAIRDALRADCGCLRENVVDGLVRSDSYIWELNLHRTIGSKGETSLRVVLGQDGKIWTAFPI